MPNLKSKPLILGIDPGFAIIGWAIIGHDKNIIDYGSITTQANQSIDKRMLEISQDFKTIIKRYQPDHLSIEQLFYFKNAKTIINVSQTRGLLVYLAAKAGLKIYEYTPLEVKTTITGYGRASKSQVQSMVKQILNLKIIPKPDDIADALALAYTHLVYFKNKGLIKKNL